MATAWKLYGIKKTCLTGKQVVGVKAVGSVVNTHWILNSNYMSEHTTLTLCQVEAENIVQRKWVLIACLIETNCAVCDCLSAAAAAWCRLHCCGKQADDNNIVYETGKHESKGAQFKFGKLKIFNHDASGWEEEGNFSTGCRSDVGFCVEISLKFHKLYLSIFSNSFGCCNDIFYSFVEIESAFFKFLVCWWCQISSFPLSSVMGTIMLSKSVRSVNYTPPTVFFRPLVKPSRQIQKKKSANIYIIKSTCSNGNQSILGMFIKFH